MTITASILSVFTLIWLGYRLNDAEDKIKELEEEIRKLKLK